MKPTTNEQTAANIREAGRMLRGVRMGPQALTGTSCFSAANIRKAVEVLRKTAIEPRYIKTKAEARAENKKMEAMGWPAPCTNWQVGDPYFTLGPTGFLK